MSTPEPSRPPLDPAELLLLLGPGTRWDVHVLDESPSTNAVLADHARAGADEGLVVVTDHQTAGRGRLDRSWVTSPRAALTFSALLAPREVEVGRWPWLPLLAGLAVVEGVRRAVGLDCVLKWPNDVLLGEEKVAGILVERVEPEEGGRGACAVVGVGVNVSSRRAELPVGSATSLELAGAGPVSRGELLVALLTSLGEEYDAWREAGGDPGRRLRAAYREECATLGRVVRVTLPSGEELTGEATDVDVFGRLQVAGPHGVRALGAGDVVHVRVP